MRDPERRPSDAPPPPVPEGRLNYADYLRVDDLVALQHPESRPPHHDEMQFIVVHQVFELWFRLLLHESDRVAAMLGRGDDPSLREAIHLCRRIARVVRGMQEQIGLLDSMKPARFLGFRDVLEPASGFQSFQFREMEAAWGMKDPGQVRHHATRPRRAARLEARLRAPSIHDRLGGMLRARGLDWPEGEGEEVLGRRIRAVKRVYEAPAEHPLLEEVLEALLEVDAQVALWRRHHVSMVERMIGRKWGTGGSQGVPYLEGTLPKRFFPEIWAVRTHLEKGPASEAPPA
ncbi:MAG: tryptophan 2,3-dioxygenase [Planctomycetaceae bacterium]|nr:tryptophan 2,3-dioxygenase family protein [Planctomycetota bacterium]NUN51976.1 tryptophan 2,3-dioxygenase [Planctomycetaceae bacterium]